LYKWVESGSIAYHFHCSKDFWCIEHCALYFQPRLNPENRFCCTFLAALAQWGMSLKLIGAVRLVYCTSAPCPKDFKYIRIWGCSWSWKWLLPDSFTVALSFNVPWALENGIANPSKSFSLFHIDWMF
jgi:hypothetical protein